MTARSSTVMDASRVFGPGSRPIRSWFVISLAAGAAAVLAGCGSTARTASSPTSPSPPRSSTTITTAPAPKVSAPVRAEEQAIHHQVQAALHHDSHASYGPLPADLRSRQKAPPNQVLSSSLTHPADAIQGVSVHLHLLGASALATAVGPDVPARYQGTFDLHAPATWAITFTDVSGRFPLAQRMFSLTDEKGQTLQPRVSAAGGGRLPKTVPTGRSFTVKLKDPLVSEGDGKLRYTPTGGLLVEWDYDVETD
jgi:hypothetical protein